MSYSLNKEYSLSLNPQQKVQCSLSMQQSLDVLQMPIEELSLWLQSQIEQNPMLEWDDSFQHTRKTSSKKKSYIDLPPQESNVPYEPSLFEYLMNQAKQNIRGSLALKQIEWIIGNLDPTGFFTTSFDSAPPDWDAKDLHSLLMQLQQFDPPGIGARTIQESLLLQLKSKGKEKTLSYSIIENHLEDLMQGRLLLIQKKCRADEKALHQAIHHEISSLDPFPGFRFHKNISPPLTPDLFLLEEGDLWKIEINEERLPSYGIKSFPSEFHTFSADDKTFFRKYMGEAKWTYYAIAKRNKTLQKIATHLVEFQKKYLKGESDTLISLSMQEIAEKTDLHESTVARAVCNKYLSCGLGIIPLKSLFSKNLNKSSENISSNQAQKLLQKLISEEDKKEPLSDRALLEKMRKIGVPCARRTITKYRQVLQIPTRRFRKKYQDI